MKEKEIWKSVKGFENYYEVSSKGRVRSLDYVQFYSRSGGKPFGRNHKGKILSQLSDVVGYQFVIIGIKGITSKRTVNVQVLVAEAFFNHNTKSGLEVHHIDGNKANNDVSNLIILSKRMHRHLHAFMYHQEYPNGKRRMFYKGKLTAHADEITLKLGAE